MGIEEYILRLENFKRTLIQRLPEFVASQALNAFGMISHRIVESGLIGEEEVLQLYKSEPYKKKRKKAGRQTEHVDLTYTRGGAGMLGSTGLVLQEMNEGVALARVAGRDSFTQDKLDWNSDRYGDILAPSTEEAQFILDQFDEWVFKIAEETGIV